MLLLWVWSPRDLPAAGSFRATFLDVGQGDAALVETADGRAMLIDGGGATDAYDAARSPIVPHHKRPVRLPHPRTWRGHTLSHTDRPPHAPRPGTWLRTH